MSTPVTRLHISPLSPDLFTAILGSEISKLATEVSFHSLQVFPESTYGYVNLPKMEADKVKKKLNGSILKGKKVRVEEARPKKRKHRDDETRVHPQEQQESDSLIVRKKKSKQERDVLPGYELPEKRKTKRGWTEPKTESTKKRKTDKTASKAKAQTSSKYTDKEELLFKTKVPKNKYTMREKPAKGKKTTGDLEVVHEFSKSTTMPSFLRSDNTIDDRAVNYEDGQGWLDEQGALVEKEGTRASRSRKAAKKGIENEVIAAQLVKNPQQNNQKAPRTERKTIKELSSGHSDSSHTETSESESQDAVARHPGPDEDGEETSSSGTSASDTTSEDSDDSTSGEEKQVGTNEVKKTTPSKSVVHPLEALFKKPTKPASSQLTATSQDNIKPSLEIQTSFSFFDQQQDDDDLPIMPMTPFSSQDLRSRGTRSAAPTPDTAHPSRMSSIFNSDESEGELSEMEEGMGDTQLGSSMQPSSSQSQTLQVPQTDFEKQFWEKRGENNRAWKARRRAVLKEKRQRENRARRPKNW